MVLSKLQTKALINFVVTAQLFCTFVLTYAISLFFCICFLLGVECSCSVVEMKNISKLMRKQANFVCLI